jgi:hypothetical protein
MRWRVHSRFFFFFFFWLQFKLAQALHLNLLPFGKDYVVAKLPPKPGRSDLGFRVNTMGEPFGQRRKTYSMQYIRM